MWKKFKKWLLDFLFGESSKKKPDIGVEAKPITIKPAFVKLLRHVGRLKNILYAMEQGDKRPELKHEAKHRQEEIAKHGYKAPTTANAAALLFDKLIGRS